MFKERLATDLKEAMKAKDAVRLRTVRSLRAALLEAEIKEREGGVAVLSEEQELRVIQKQAKQRRDSIEQFLQADRKELADKEQEELTIIESYLPNQLSEEEISKAIEEIIQNVGATEMRDMGKVMGPAMASLKGRADGKVVQQIVRKLLSSN